MKKTYEAPSIEVVKFQYRDQVVAASGHLPTCEKVYSHGDGGSGIEDCTTGNQLVSWNQ
jgi:hypothetical protein